MDSFHLWRSRANVYQEVIIRLFVIEFVNRLTVRDTVIGKIKSLAT